MLPLELDKPSTAPIRSDTLDDEIRLQDAQINGQKTVVAKDGEDRIAFPTVVPPDVESLESPDSSRKGVTTAPGAASGQHLKVPDATSAAAAPATATPATATTATLADDDNVANSKPISEANSVVAKKGVETRPENQKRLFTDLPRNPRLGSGIPLMRRAGTNVSVLNQRLQRSYASYMPEEDSAGDSTGDSSSEDEENEVSQSGGGHNNSKQSRRKEKDENLYRRFQVASEYYRTKGNVSKRDGRLNISVHDTSNTGYLAKALGSAVKKVTLSPSKKPAQGQLEKIAASRRAEVSRLSSETTTTSESIDRPRLNIVIMVIGSRGDAQPFLKIGKVLKENYGHRVRIATHPAFRDFVEKDSGLEFFSVGGDPSELMAFMVKNPGMIPKLETVTSGDIGRRRAAMAEMFEGFWRACINTTDNEKDINNVKMLGERDPFIADAIIANPPSFAHVHCAEALGIPLHLMFTFPYTPTQAFPHPLAKIKNSNVDPGYTNFISYPLVEMMVWQGLGDLVNNFRVKTLGLDPVSTLWAPGSTYRLHVPVTYLWSPGIVPKPEDWGEEIDISGFVFLDLASSFQPPDDLIEFMDGGDMPIYIGFGSIVVDDPGMFTEMIFEAIKLSGVRALVSKGWGGLGQDDVPDNIFMLGNTPHDWLFPRVKACVIHGGAGTTAIALKCGKPTMIVPFFGDQHFWGSMVAGAGAGPDPIPFKQLDVEQLTAGIKYCLTDEAARGAQKIAKDIELEGDGAKNAVRSFHHHLTLSGEKSMRCSILHDRIATWNVKNTSLKLSPLAADILVGKGYLSWRRLRTLRHKDWNDFEGPGEPLTGIAGSLIGTVGDFVSGFGSVPYRLAKTSNERNERRRKREERRRQKLQQKRKAAKAKTPAATNGTAETPGFPFPKHGTEAKDQQPGEKTKQPHDAKGNLGSLASTPGTGFPTGNAVEEYTNQVSQGITKSGRAIARAPVDLSMAIAQGFHNAPRLYGDDTVRRPTRVTGFHSGLRAAGSEFVYGIYDGVTGLVRLPVKGAKEDGIRGALAGVGMGIGGFFLKDIAAIVAPVGYTLKGVSKQFGRHRQPQKHVRRARIVQAQRETHELDQEDHRRIVEKVYKGWNVMTQLGELIKAENAKRYGGMLARVQKGKDKLRKDSQIGRLGKGRAFESVEMAEHAIAAIKSGEDAHVVVGGHKKSLSLPRFSLGSAGARKSRDGGAGENAAVASRRSKEEERKKVDESAEKNARQALQDDVGMHT